MVLTCFLTGRWRRREFLLAHVQLPTPKDRERRRERERDTEKRTSVEKQMTSSKQNKKVASPLEKSCLVEKKKLFEIHRVEWFYMTKQLHYKMPPASLERHQMYKDDLFLDFNCLIILAAPRRLCCIKLISPLAEPSATPPWFEAHSPDTLIKPLTHQNKKPQKIAKNIFSTKEWLIDIND